MHSAFSIIALLDAHTSIREYPFSFMHSAFGHGPFGGGLNACPDGFGHLFIESICHRHCICLRLCCLFVGQVLFSHDSHQFCEVGVWSGRPEGFESNTISE